MKELFIYNSDDCDGIFLVEDGILIEKYSDINRKNRIEGNIYIGKVQNVVPGLQAAFIDIGEKKNAFIHLKDILPKIDSSIQNDIPDYNLLNIKDYVKQGMPILIEIKRDSYSQKGARASTHINLPGRLTVLLPNSTFITVSQKIDDESEKNRLKNIVRNFLPENMGAIIRTSAEKKSEKEIVNDLEILINQWNKIISTKVSEENIPKIIFKNNDLINKILRDLIDNGLDRIIVNTEEAKNRIGKVLEAFEKNDIEIEVKNEGILDIYQLNKRISDAENRKVWLKNGGFITIDKTEALTAIDVNSGKYTGKDGLANTALTVNKEAAIEIAKQIRLRDIGGIIVIDFIDLIYDENRDEIINIFSKELKKDRSKIQIEGFTKLDLLELTRKHICSN